MKNNKLKKVCSIVVALIHIGASCVWANPAGESVVAGQATFDRVGNDLNVTTSDKVIINYDSFSIGSQESVNFFQPSSASVALNRVVGGDVSEIFGSLNANGQIFLVNPNGILFGAGSSVNVAGLVASSLDISNQDFIDGTYHFFNNHDGAPAVILNQGLINIAEKGSVSFIGGAVGNEGVISANLGQVNLVAGDVVTLNLDNNGIFSVAVDEAIMADVVDFNGEKVEDAIVNTGEIIADGGRVGIRAEAIKGIFTNLVNQEGLVRAGSMVEKDGKIMLVGNGTIRNSGTLDVSGLTDGADGGLISIEGEDIVNNGALLANATDNARAGDINVIAQNDLVLSENSRIEAKGKDINSEGGDVYLYAHGNAVAKDGQVIDISGGSVSGDAGDGEFSAANNVTMAGTVIGAAQAGYSMGHLLIDPLNASVSGNFAANTTIQAEDNITIDGNTTIDTTAGNVTLTLLADHLDTTVGNWDDGTGGFGGTAGVGTITRSGNYTISESAGANISTLVMRSGSDGAGTGIGNPSDVILTNVDAIEAAINPASTNGRIFISDSGALTINGITAPSGYVSITSAGNMTLNGGISSLNDGITLNAGTAQIDTNDQSIFTGSGGDIILIADSLDLGTAASRISTTGNIYLRPSTGSTTIGLGNGATGAFNLDSAELTALTAGMSNLEIGVTGGTGAMDINDISFITADLTFRGGAATVDHINAGTNAVQFYTIGDITDNNGAATNVTGNFLRVSNGASNSVDLDTSVDRMMLSMTKSANIYNNKALELSISNIQGGASTIQTNNADIKITGTFANHNGDLVLNAGTAGIDVDLAVFTGSGDLTLISDSIDLDDAGTNAIETTGTLNFQPFSAGTTMGIGDGSSGGYHLSRAEVAKVMDGTSMVVLGKAGDTRTVNLNNGAGEATLGFSDYLTLYGGDINVGKYSSYSNDMTITSTGNIYNSNSGGGANIYTGRLYATANNIGTLSKPLDVYANFGKIDADVTGSLLALDSGAQLYDLRLNADNGDIVFNNTGSGYFMIQNAPMTANNISLTTAGFAYVAKDIIADNGMVTINVTGEDIGSGITNFTLNSGVTISGSQGVTIASNDMDIAGQITSPQKVTLAAYDTNTDILVSNTAASANNLADTLELSPDEIDNITASVIAIGSLNSRDVTISEALTLDPNINLFQVISGRNMLIDVDTPTSVDTVLLSSGGTMDVTGKVEVANLLVSSTGNATLTNPANDVTDNLTVNMTGDGDFRYVDANKLNEDADANNIVTQGGDVYVTIPEVDSYGNGIVFSQDFLNITTNGGDIHVKYPKGFVLMSTMNSLGTGGRADGDIYIENLNPGDTFAIGTQWVGGFNPSFEMETYLLNLPMVTYYIESGTGRFVFGSTTAGDITYGKEISNLAGKDISFITGGNINPYNGLGDPIINANSLILDAGGNIGGSNDFQGLALHTLANSIQATAIGEIRINEENDVTLNDITALAGGIDIRTLNSGTITVAGDVLTLMDTLNLDSTAGLTINGTVTGASDVTLSAYDTLAVDGAVTSNNGKVISTADAVTTSAAVLASSDVSLTAQNGDTTVGASVTSTNGGVTINGDNITTTAAILASSDVSITSNNGDVTTGAAVTSTSGGITIESAQALTTQQTVDALTDILLKSNAGNTTITGTVTSNNGGISIEASQTVSQQGILTADENITLTAANDVNVRADITASKDVDLTATDGDVDLRSNVQGKIVTLAAGNNIVDTTDASTRIIADEVRIDNAQKVGSSEANGRLDLEVALLQDNTIPGDIYINEVDDITLKSLHSTNGVVDVVAGGSIFNQFDGTGDEISGANGVRLDAQGTIGDLNNSIHVNSASGNIIVSAGQSADELSIYLTADNLVSSRLELANVPPGLVLFNGQINGGAPIQRIKNQGFAATHATANTYLDLNAARAVNGWHNSAVYYPSSTRLQNVSIQDWIQFGKHPYLDMTGLGYDSGADPYGLMFSEKNWSVKSPFNVYLPFIQPTPSMGVGH